MLLKWRKILIICFVITGMILIFPHEAAARSYSFLQLDIEAIIQEDGSMDVTEHRTVDFNGTYSGLYQWINKQPGQQITDIVVMEQGQAYEFNSGNEFGPAGTYLVKDNEDSAYIDWSFDATDEQRIFTLKYKVINAVKLHNDVAELYYQFIGDEWEVGIDNVLVSLILPDGAKVGDIRAWGHGPLNGNVTIKSDQLVTWDIQQLPAKAFLTGRVTFPKELVSQGKNITNQAALPNILEQEQKWADEANQERTQSKVSWILSLMIVIGGFIYSIYMWTRYGKAYKTQFEGDYYRDLPADYTPAEMAVLWRFNIITPAEITATIMDLARRKYIRIDEVITEEKQLFKKKQSVDYKLTICNSEYGSLLKHENDLLNFIFQNVSTNKMDVSFREIEKYAKNNKKAFADFWNKWEKELKNRGKELNFFDKHSGGHTLKHSIPGIILILLGIAMLIWNANSFANIALAALIGGFVYLISIAFHARRTRAGQEQHNKWRAFKRFLQHFSNMDKHDIPSLVIWEHYLVYAIPLGIAKEVMKQLQLVYPNLEHNNHQFGYGWYYYNANIASFTGLSNSLDTMTNSITQSLQQSISTATGQSSSASGAGGGFTGGGGGGFGGGGGGGAR
jgi:uncharacterized membrane protein